MFQRTSRIFQNKKCEWSWQKFTHFEVYPFGWQQVQNWVVVGWPNLKYFE